MIEKPENRKRLDKRWGWEEWIVNNEEYCGKRLHFNKMGISTSIHFHVKKAETMYVERGLFQVTTFSIKQDYFGNRTGECVIYTLRPGESITIPRYMPHRIEAQVLSSCGDAIMIEFSTHDDIEDSYRIVL